jgi:hypothetical protein
MSLHSRLLHISPAMKRRMRSGWPSGFAVVQFPNLPLIVALLASIAGLFTHGTGHRVVLSVFYVALSVWAYLEARHGDNWFRRLLGVGFSVYIIVNLAQALHT